MDSSVSRKSTHARVEIRSSLLLIIQSSSGHSESTGGKSSREDGAAGGPWSGQDRETAEADVMISEGQRSLKLTSVSPESTSSREMRLCPSLRSSYRSVMCLWA